MLQRETLDGGTAYHGNYINSTARHASVAACLLSQLKSYRSHIKVLAK